MTRSNTFNVLLLGAGAVVFEEGPWCHTTRLERKLEGRLNVVGVVEPHAPRADAALAKKRAVNVPGYSDTKVFTSLAAAGEALTGDLAPHLVLFGIQPTIRGGTQPGRDMELQVKAIWPTAAMFLEKPISAAPLDEVRAVADEIRGGVVSVGYMLRYLKAVEKMKAILKDNNLQVRACIATYIMAYEWAGQQGMDYFDLRKEPMGPIVSQATHFVDLCRYLCGEADLSTVHALTVRSTEPAGGLSRLVSDIPDEYSIPRTTDAMWKWENGGVCTLVHAVALHDGVFDCEIVLITDGWKLRLVDPYGTPKLYTTRPGHASDVEEVVYDGDDPFYSEINAIVDYMDGVAGPEVILSTYDDAVNTYALTRAIREAGEALAKVA